MRSLRASSLLRFSLAAAVIIALPVRSEAQGLVQSVQQGASAGNRAAGPVGGVLGGAIGGVVGVVTGVLGVPAQQAAPAQRATPPASVPSKQATPAKSTKPTKQVKGDKAERREAAEKNVAPQAAAAVPVALTAEQIVATSDANIERIKTELKLTPDQEKHWGGFTSAMHYLGRNGADRVALRATRARRDPPDDIIEQMRNEAQFLTDRAADQRSVADAAEPLFASLDEKQKSIFIEEMVRLSLERGLD